MKAKNRFVCALVLMSVLVCLAGTCSATVFYVTKQGNNSNSGLSWANAKLTIGAAITAAAALTGEDQIWVKYGTYVESITINDAVSLYGGFVGNETAVSQRPVFFRSSPDTYETIIKIQSPATGTVVWVNGTGNTSEYIDGFTITGGCAVQTPGVPPGSTAGSGVVIYNGIMTLRNNSIIYNQGAGYFGYGGAGISIMYGTVDILHNKICNNATQFARDGGGISVGGTTRIINNVIANNTAWFSSSAWTKGGGIYASRGVATLIRSNLIYGNTSNHGGGMHVTGTSQVFTSILANTICKNTAHYQEPGGPIQDVGGAIYTWGCISLSYNIIALNDSGVLGPVMTGGYRNLVYSNGAYNYVNFVSTNDLVNINPLFVDSTNNDYHLQESPTLSPCIDAATLTQMEYNMLNQTLDIDLEPRVINGYNMDIGADEIQ